MKEPDVMADFGHADGAGLKEKTGYTQVGIPHEAKHQYVNKTTKSFSVANWMT